MGLLNFSDVKEFIHWFGVSEPFHFGHPKFVAAAIISMCIVMLVTYTESTADMLAVAEMVDRPLSENGLAHGLATDGLSAVLAGFMNSFPDTAYAENVGLIEITKIQESLGGRHVWSLPADPWRPHPEWARSSRRCPARSSVVPAPSCSPW